MYFDKRNLNAYSFKHTYDGFLVISLNHRILELYLALYDVCVMYCLNLNSNNLQTLISAYAFN